MNEFENKRVLIVGLGKSGIAAAEALLRLGAEVSVYDSKKEDEIDARLPSFLKSEDVEYYFGKSPEKPGAFDQYILSPGVSPELGFIKDAERAGVEIVGELETAYRIGSGNFVAITGTNGKTTTTTLTGEMFRKAGRETYVVGNIGTAVISAILDTKDNPWFITETSSFQLETTRSFKPRLSALLNLTPDHMDRHKTMGEYGRAKAKIYQNQDESDFFVVNYDDPECLELSKGCRAKIVPFSRLCHLEYGVFVKDGMIVIRNGDKEIIPLCLPEELQIPGAHNLENALAASALAYFAGISADVIADALRMFKGVEHRLEMCGDVSGVRFINDSKGTNPDASIKAVEAISGNIILIAGGYDKRSDFGPFIDSFNGKVKHMMLMGSTAGQIRETAEKKGFMGSVILKDMEECVKEAFERALPGDTVLLSPACASWDMYDCFEQRGEHFKKCVAGLRE